VFGRRKSIARRKIDGGKIKSISEFSTKPDKNERSFFDKVKEMFS